MAKKDQGRVPTLQSAVVSYILAQEDANAIEGKMDGLRRFLQRKGISEVSSQHLLKLVKTETWRLESVEKDAEELADLFSREHEPRKEKYRYGSAFCSSCGMFKNYEKECPYCNKIEITI